MCVVEYRKVLHIDGKNVTLVGGRIAKLAPIGKVKVGDTVEVYADLVIGKIDKTTRGTKSDKHIYI